MKKKSTFRFLFLVCFSLILSKLSFAQGISFSTNPNNGCNPLTVTFTNTSTNANAYRYEWYFGDGSAVFIDTSS
ncbi:MAG: hypothetical protein WBM13_14645, partial [Bacteroidia bacterium]